MKNHCDCVPQRGYMLCPTKKHYVCNECYREHKCEGGGEWKEKK